MVGRKRLRSRHSSYDLMSSGWLRLGATERGAGSIVPSKEQHLLSNTNDEPTVSLLWTSSGSKLFEFGHASTYHSSSSGNVTTNHRRENLPDIAQGCLLIPAVFAVWWFWTKNAARNACRRGAQILLLTPSNINNNSNTAPRPTWSRPPITCYVCGTSGDSTACMCYPNESSDEFKAREQVVRQQQQQDPNHHTCSLSSSSPSSLRLVKWLHGREQLHRASVQLQEQERHERQQSLRRRFADWSHVTSGTAELPDMDVVDDGDGDDACFGSSTHWQYIPDMTDIELCSITSGMLVGGDDEDDAYAEDVLSAVSMGVDACTTSSNARYHEFL